MVELKFGPRTVDLPYTVRIRDVTEEMFDELVDEDTKAELIDGVMIVHSPASPRHDDIGGFLRSLMRVYAGKKRLGKVLGPDSLIRIGLGRKFSPDIFFYEKARLPTPLPEKEFNGAPNLIAEILSPSNKDDDLEIKRPAYQKARVEEVWFVDPELQEVHVDRRQKKRYAAKRFTEGRLESTALDGFWIDLAWLWADELPDELDCLKEIIA